jgi:uncharacterized alpha-E superfamily protein
MKDLLTANVANSLYWFGRYLERIEETLIASINAFDAIIDVDSDAGKTLYDKLDVAIEYTSPAEFLDVAFFGEHTANLLEAAYWARENAIISRTQFHTEAFGTVIKLYELFSKASKSTNYVDYEFTNQALALISEIWGNLTREQERGKKDYFIRLGKLIEKVDFHLRIDKDKDFALIVMDEIDTIVALLTSDIELKDHSKSSKDELLESVNKKIDKIIVF